MKYKKYVKLCEMIGITPLSFSNWIEKQDIPISREGILIALTRCE